MRALVVYESMYGNTRAVAGDIADGLRADFEVTVVPVAEATAELVAAPESFLVTSQSTLLDGEAARARRWGMTIGAASKTYLPAHA